MTGGGGTRSPDAEETRGPSGDLAGRLGLHVGPHASDLPGSSSVLVTPCPVCSVPVGKPLALGRLRSWLRRQRRKGRVLRVFG